MNIFLIFLFLFGLAALAVVCYYKLTPTGRVEDVHSELEESRLQGKLLDSIEATRKEQAILHERLESLRK